MVLHCTFTVIWKPLCHKKFYFSQPCSPYGQTLILGYFQKRNQIGGRGGEAGGGGGCWGHGITRGGIEERKCGNSRGQLRKKWSFHGCSSKNFKWNFHGSWFLTLEFPRIVTQFCWIFRGESLFSQKSSNRKHITHVILKLNCQCQTQRIFIWVTDCLCYCVNLVPPMMGAEGKKIFDFDNPRLLEKVLLGKELHQNYFYLLKTTKSNKQYQNMSGVHPWLLPETRGPNL